MAHDKNLDTNLRDILDKIGKELHFSSIQYIEVLKNHLAKNKEIVIDKAIFQSVMQIRKGEMNVSQEAIHYLLSHCIKNRSVNTQDKTLSFKYVIDCLKEAMRAQGYFHDSTLNKLLNYRDQDGNSLLHKAVLANNTDSINTLLVNDVNSLAVNNKDQTPFTLDGISLSAKSALNDGIREQSKRYKENTMTNASIAFAAGYFSTVGVGTAMSLVLGDGTNSCRTAVAIGMSLALLVGGVALLAVYSFSPDYKQAKAIDTFLFSKAASLEATETTRVGDNQNRIV